jgi:hypothetical protein
MRDRPHDASARRPPRRLSDKIFIAFHLACDQHELEVAERLLAVLETVIAGRWHQATAPDRRGKDSLVAAYERFWNLRHSDPIQETERASTR